MIAVRSPISPSVNLSSLNMMAKSNCCSKNVPMGIFCMACLQRNNTIFNIKTNHYKCRFWQFRKSLFKFKILKYCMTIFVTVVLIYSIDPFWLQNYIFYFFVWFLTCIILCDDVLTKETPFSMEGMNNFDIWVTSMEGMNNSDIRVPSMEGMNNSDIRIHSMEGKNNSDIWVTSMEGKNNSDTRVHSMESKNNSDTKVTSMEGMNNSDKKFNFYQG